jgi:hypothetical protein
MINEMDSIVAEYRTEIENWKSDYSITRAVYQIARSQRMNAISGSPDWVRYDRIATLAFNLMGAILEGNPQNV